MTNFPSHKRDWSELKSVMNEARSNDLIWNNERAFKPAYFAGDDVLELAHESYHTAKPPIRVFINMKLNSSTCSLIC